MSPEQLVPSDSRQPVLQLCPSKRDPATLSGRSVVRTVATQTMGRPLSVLKLPALLSESTFTRPIRSSLPEGLFRSQPFYT